MLSLSDLRRRGRSSSQFQNPEVESGVTLASDLATWEAAKLGCERPSCFGVLYDAELDCRGCRLAEYCAYVVKHGHFPYQMVRERDLEPVMRTGFKDGSRAAILIQRWAMRYLTVAQLERLSQKIFGSIIDIERIITQLRKKRLLLAEKGGRFGVRPARY
jgi:hypothetical protein